MSLAELIIGNLFLASLIGVLALVVGRGGRRAGLAHALWIMFFAKLITPPLVSVPLPIPSIRTVTLTDTPDAAVSPVKKMPATRSAAAMSSEQSSDVSSAQATSLVATETLIRGNNGDSVRDRMVGMVGAVPMNAVLLVWFGGFSFVVGRGILRLVRFRRLLDQCGTFDSDATELVRGFLMQHRRWKFLGRSPRVVRVSVRVSPMLFGCALRPIIVCPEQLWQSLSADDRKAFLAHETAHFHRRDHWVRWLEWFVSAVYWWFPGVYFAQKQLERHEEACCDLWAVKILKTKPRHYADALLRVVDFISDYQVGLPSLASGMQPTDSLEERLRLLMRNELDNAASRLHTWGSGLACAAIWMVHPDAYPLQWTSAQAPSSERVSMDSNFAPLPAIDVSSAAPGLSEDLLPAAPNGFWNTPPIRNWAGFSFDVSEYQFRAFAGNGFIIERSPAEPLLFDDQSLTAIAEIPASGRVIIGDAAGNVRLWDLHAGMPVSLLGRHSGDVTSLTVSPQGSVFSADSSGSVIRWELQSGQTLARWTSDEVAHSTIPVSTSIQSIRSSQDGQWIATLCGDWREASAEKSLYLLDSQTLTPQAHLLTAPDTAVVLQDSQQRWISVSWSGVVRAVDSMERIGVIEKHHVSALVLSQHAGLREPRLIGQTNQ
ncbi:MAG: hypothetical protein KDB00_01795 [Planctomycetales bacterium]|nr:hypothetical protein [Planctomycetales bacterium]